MPSSQTWNRLHASSPEAEVSTYSTEFAGSQDFSNTLLCGHTHSPGIYRDGNILVLTAGARYGFPDITKTIHLDRLGSIFE
jgi:predicted phosphodiesterase